MRSAARQGRRGSPRPGRTPHPALRVRAPPDRRPLRPGDPGGRAAALDEAAPVVAKIKTGSVQREVAVQLAGFVGILDQEYVVHRVNQLAQWARGRGDQRGSARPSSRAAAQHQQVQAPAAPSGPALNLRSPAHRTERELLKLALQKPALVSPAFDAYGVDEFTAPPYAAVRQCIAEAGGAEMGVAETREYLVQVLDATPNDAVRKLVTELAVEVIHGKSIDEAYAGEQLVQVRLRAVDRRIDDVQGSLARLGTNVAPDHLAAAQNEVWVLQKYAESLRINGADAL